jgi:hypothetical protein
MRSWQVTMYNYIWKKLLSLLNNMDIQICSI